MGIAAFFATAVGKIVLVAIGLVVTAGVAGLSLYLMDYGVEATVIGKDCSAPSVTVQERLTRLTHTQPIDPVPCAAVQEGNFVLYNINSQRVRVWDTEARENLIWDSLWLADGGAGGGGLPVGNVWTPPARVV